MTKFELISLWLIIVLAPAALADVHFVSDFRSDGGEFSSYSEGIDHKISASGTGNSNYRLVADLESSMQSDVRQEINSTKGSFSARTPEYFLRIRKATNLTAASSLSRESTVEESEQIVTEVENGSLVQTITTTYTDAAIDISARGDGYLAEDITIAYPGKGRALKLRELDANGAFNLSTTVTLSGESTMKGFGRLNETEYFDRRHVLATDPETGNGPLGGI
jgi:hypothetical protein